MNKLYILLGILVVITVTLSILFLKTNYELNNAMKNSSKIVNFLVDNQINSNKKIVGDTILGTNTGEESAVKISFTNPKDLINFLSLTQDQIIKLLGANYDQKSYDDNTGTYTIVTYKEKNLSFRFNKNKNTDYIYCSGGVSINGATAGMNFEQIQKKIGQGTLGHVYNSIGGLINIDIYTLSYNFNGNKVLFYSYENNGQNSKLTLSKEGLDIKQ